jgi:hypothetical protein
LRHPCHRGARTQVNDVSGPSWLEAIFTIWRSESDLEFFQAPFYINWMVPKAGLSISIAFTFPTLCSNFIGAHIFWTQSIFGQAGGRSSKGSKCLREGSCASRLTIDRGGSLNGAQPLCGHQITATLKEDMKKEEREWDFKPTGALMDSPARCSAGNSRMSYSRIYGVWSGSGNRTQFFLPEDLCPTMDSPTQYI